MPPKGKKKKPAANPARGFATTSVASKPKPEKGIDLTGSDDADASKQSNTVTVTETVTSTANPSALAERPVADLSPEEFERRLEEGELQGLVEKYSAKSSRDASRHVAKVRTDCRLLRASATPVSWRGLLSEQLTAEILALARDDVTTGRLVSTAEPERKRLKEEDAIARLWTLWRALLDLGFAPQLVSDASRFILRYPPDPESGGLVWGFEQCLDWLVLNSSEADLPTFDSGTGKVRGSNDQSTLESLPELDDHQNNGQDADWKSKKAAVDASKQQETSKEDHDHDDIEVSDLDSDLDPDEILSAWLATKVKLYEIRPDIFNNIHPGGKKRIPKSLADTKAPSAGVRKLQQKLTKIESDVLFDRHDAEEKWVLRRNQLAQDLADRRRAELTEMTQGAEERPNSSHSTSSAPSEAPSKEVNTPATTEDAAEDEDDFVGGLFGEAVEQAEAEAAQLSERAAADTLNVRLVSMPQWKGLTPRRVLEETCRARDSGVKFAYKLVSLSAWSNRHSVTITWSKAQVLQPLLDLREVGSTIHSRMLRFTMNEIACSREQDSEAYVCTFALHQIFASVPKEGKAYLRLPAVWRDVYLNFAEQGKAESERADRETVLELRNLVREQQQQDEDEDVIHTKSFEARSLERSRNRGDEQTRNEAGAISEETQRLLQKIWIDKSSTPAYQAMLTSRNTLPMAQFKNLCLETVSKSQVTILCGETGCGKSTQMPAFILEYELMQGRPCKIYCTEPRRISAITLAQRVSQEMGEAKNACGTSRSLVGYAIRLESNVTSTTRLVFATTGIVLRMLESKDGFSDITHIVVDEVHERSIETDFLLIILRRLLATRPTLKVVLMSATVDAQRFADYFSGAPILNVPGRTFPVETRFLEDAIELTGYKSEDNNNEKNVEDDEETVDGASVPDNADAKDQYLKDYSKATKNALAKYNEYRIDYGLIASLIEAISANPLYSETGYGRAILVFLPGLAEIRQMSDMLIGSGIGQRYDIHQLHSTIASEDQQLAFEYPPHGRGKIVLSTNIAETGVTIPDITCVIDTGKHKEMRFEERRQVSRLLESFISRANAKQRRGRAGRVQKGLCFHLFTKYRHDALMAAQQTPEMLRLSLQDLIMRVKITKLGDIQTALSSALDPPAAKNIRRAIDSLVEVGALTSAEELTALGQQISKLPLDPYLGKLVLYGAVYGCLEVVLTVAAILTSKSPFVSPVGARKQADLARTAFKKADSDLLTEYNAYASWKRVCTESPTSEYQFCRKNMLSPQTLSNIEDLKGQLMSALRDTGLLSGLPKEAQTSSSNGPRRGRKFVQVPLAAAKHSSFTSPLVSGLIAWALYPKILARDPSARHSFRSISTNQAIALHPTSIPRLSPPSSPLTLALVSYYSIVQSSGGAKNYNASGITPVHPLVLLLGPAGEARFDGVAGAVILDGARLRLMLGEGTPAGWRVLTAVKFLRLRVEEWLRTRWRGREVGPKLARWWDLWGRVVEAWEVEAREREARAV